MGRPLTLLALCTLCVACFDPDTSNPLATDADTSAPTGSTTTASTTDPSESTSTTDPSESTSTADPTESTSMTDPSAGSTGPQVDCGNGRTEAGEGCDDGNAESGDGCSAACQDETVFCEPRVIGSYINMLAPFSHIAEAGDRVVAVDTDANPAVTLIDISDPTVPQFVTSLTLAAVTAIDLIARADRVIVIGDPLATAIAVSGGTLTQVDQIDGSSEFGFQATLQGTTIYIADDATTRVIAAAQITNLNLTTANVNLQGVMFPSYDGIASTTNRVFVSVNGELGVFDVSDAFNPALLSSVSLTGGGGGPLRVTDDGNYVINDAGEGVGIYDVSDSDQPAYVTTASLPQGSATRNIASRGTFVYSASDNGEVFAIDISNPATPGDATVVDVGDDPATDVHAGGDYLYVLQAGTVHLVADLPGYCEGACGNGVVEYPEACDDGNLIAGDGCEPSCTA